MRTRVILEHEGSDRNIVLFFGDDTKLAGVNFWQGKGDMTISDTFIARLCNNVTPFVEANIVGGLSKVDTSNYESFIEEIDEGIWNFVHFKNREDKMNVEVLSYIEDGNLVMAIRSLRPFEGSEFDGEFYYKYFGDDNNDLYISESISF